MRLFLFEYAFVKLQVLQEGDAVLDIVVKYPVFFNQWYFFPVGLYERFKEFARLKRPPELKRL